MNLHHGNGRAYEVYAVGARISRRSNKIQNKEKENKSGVRERNLRVGGVRREKSHKMKMNDAQLEQVVFVMGPSLIPRPAHRPGAALCFYTPRPCPRQKWEARNGARGMSRVGLRTGAGRG